MTVGYSAGNVGAGDSTQLDTRVDAGFNMTPNGDCIVAGVSFSAADLALGPFVVGDNELDDLTRKVYYGDILMTSLGVIQWGTLQAWTEAFALLDAPQGEHRITAAVGGGAPSKRFLRAAASSFNSVDSVGTPVLLSGSTTAMTLSATAATADRVVGVFGTKSGIAGISGAQQRYLNNTGISLLIGDAPGTGTPQNITGTRQKTGAWGGILVPLNAADTIATCPPISMQTGFGPTLAYCEPRLGGLRRQIFKVPIKSLQKQIGTADPKTPDDVTPITMDWSDFLATTMDRIRDFWFTTPGVEVDKRWFTDTDATLLVSGGSVGSVTLTYSIRTWGGEIYSRSIKLPIKNL